jgi:hypothetical protein
VLAAVTSTLGLDLEALEMEETSSLRLAMHQPLLPLVVQSFFKAEMVGVLI